MSQQSCLSLLQNEIPTNTQQSVRVSSARMVPSAELAEAGCELAFGEWACWMTLYKSTPRLLIPPWFSHQAQHSFSVRSTSSSPDRWFFGARNLNTPSATCSSQCLTWLTVIALSVSSFLLSTSLQIHCLRTTRTIATRSERTIFVHSRKEKTTK